MNIGNKIKKLRSALKMTSSELANRSGVAQSFISKLERGNAAPTVDTMQRICTAFNITLTDFFSDHTTELPKEFIQLVELASQLSTSELKILNELLQAYIRQKKEN